MLAWRRADAGAATRRRRVCSSCGHRFTTFERRERPPLAVVKRDGERQRFDRAKLRAALLRSTHKRQLGTTQVEALVDRVEREVDRAGGELDASRIGELCLEGLAELDRGAYLQFLGTLPAAVAHAAGAESAPGGAGRSAGVSAGLAAQAG